MLLLVFGDGFGDEVVAGGVEVQQRVADGGFEVVGVEAVDVAAGGGAVAGPAPAGVVAVGLVPAASGGADVAAPRNSGRLTGCRSDRAPGSGPWPAAALPMAWSLI